MTTDVFELESRLNVVLESLEAERKEFEEAAKLCVEAIFGIHQRLERIEKWMLKPNEQSGKLVLPPTKTRTTAALKKIHERPSSR